MSRLRCAISSTARSAIGALVGALGGVAFAVSCVSSDRPSEPDPGPNPGPSITSPPPKAPAPRPSVEGGGEPVSGPEPEPGTVVSTTVPAERAAELEAIEQALDACEGLTAGAFAERHAVAFAPSDLPYEPGSAQFLPLIQESALALDEDEIERLATNGFVVSDRKRFPTFAYGYAAIYSQDLPLYVSADSILHAVHRSYDAMLAAIEGTLFTHELWRLLSSMRSRIPGLTSAGFSDAAQSDADVYLAVAMSLLQDKATDTIRGGREAEVAALFDLAKGAEGPAEVVLFGGARTIDFSAFRPRGHYRATPQLERYFRAMTWLGRADLRLLEPGPDGTQLFHRRQLEGALALASLLDEGALASFRSLHGTITLFAGEQDSMTVPEASALLADLGLSDPSRLADLPDSTIAQAIVNGGYGAQRVASHLVVNGLGAGTMPAAASFALFGQRYTVDAHVLSNLVFDRVQGGQLARMMPNPLDAAFAALGNDHAGSLLAGELAEQPYAPDLCAMRTLVDAHGDDPAGSSLYGLWLSALRTLSPSAGGGAAPSAPGLPSVVTTEPWARRLLSTQLASWAELRHDALLHAKPAYTAAAVCEYPDAYVDPYPELYASLERFAEKGPTLLDGLDLTTAPALGDRIAAWLDHLAFVAASLREMAELERAALPLTDAHLAFINDAVTIQEGCGDPHAATGWYGKLFFNPGSAVQLDPTIADVHVQPTDESGNEVGRILHVGTGLPRLLVVTVHTCAGPRAYVGLASSYFERTTEKWDRLDDERWAAELLEETPADPPWLEDLVVR